jgi:3-isopropylmalate/(R)-2-methylmalate dehydratase small subunit
MTTMEFTGKAWKFGDNISTDLIQPADVTWGHVRGPERLKYCMRANRPGWAEQVEQGDVVVAGRNFGCGSSRPAARMLRDLGIICVVAESVSRIFMRNAVNIGWPALICPGITDLVEEGDQVYVNVDTGEVRNLRTGATLTAEGFPEGSPPYEILRAGGLQPLLRKMLVEQGIKAPPERHFPADTRATPVPGNF